MVRARPGSPPTPGHDIMSCPPQLAYGTLGLAFPFSLGRPEPDRQHRPADRLEKRILHRVRVALGPETDERRRSRDFLRGGP